MTVLVSAKADTRPINKDLARARLTACIMPAPPHSFTAPNSKAQPTSRAVVGNTSAVLEAPKSAVGKKFSLRGFSGWWVWRRCVLLLAPLRSVMRHLPQARVLAHAGVRADVQASLAPCCALPGKGGVSA